MNSHYYIRFRTVLPLLCYVLAIWPMLSANASTLSKSRQVFEQHKSAVVTIQLVVKSQMSMHGKGGNANEMKQEITGTVMNRDGLIVTSLSAIDPTSVYKAMMGPGDAGFNMESNVTSASILLEDGTELPARVILRDPDLDLAFIRPLEKPDAPMPHVDFTEDASPGLLEEVVAINRLGRVARRTHTASLERIEGIVTKPRTFYIPGQGQGGSNASVGCPAFALGGNLIGIAVLRTAHSKGFDMRGNFLVILVPAADILEAAEQAPPLEAGDETKQ